MASTDDLVGRRNTWIREGRLRFWGVPGRTLPNVVDDIHNGAPRLEMSPSPPPSPRALAAEAVLLALVFFRTGAVDTFLASRHAVHRAIA
jgi:hypothetical protein